MRTLLLSGTLLVCGAAITMAQNDLPTFTAACAGRGGTVRSAGASLVCDTSAAPAASSVDSSSMLSMATRFGEALGAFLKEDARRAEERARRRRFMEELLQQHQREAVLRQDASRAEDLRLIERRLAGSDLSFKGWTGSGSQLDVKLESGTGLGLKVGDRATESLRAPSAMPSASTPVVTAAMLASDEGDILKLIARLPAEEQQRLLDELRGRIAGGSLPSTPAPTRDVPLAFKLPDTPSLDPNASAEAAKTLGDEDFARRTRTGIAGGEIVVPAIDPPVAIRRDPCAPPAGLHPSVVALMCTVDVVDPTKLRPNLARLDVARASTDASQSPYWQASESLLQGAEIPAERRAALINGSTATVSRYRTDAAFASQLDAAVDREVRLARSLLGNLNDAAWFLSLELLQQLMEQHSEGQAIDPVALMANPAFVREFNAFNARLAQERAQNADTVTLELSRGLRRVFSQLP
jgi:hypothetical protein